MEMNSHGARLAGRRRSRRFVPAGLGVVAMLGICLPTENASAQTFGRVSGQAGHPNPLAGNYCDNCLECFQVGQNYIFAQAQTTGGPCTFPESDYQWWQMNPFTKNTASTVSTYFEGRVYSDQSICFRAFSWTRYGVLHDSYTSPDWCEVASTGYEDFTTGAVSVDVPNYGNMSVLAGWEVLATDTAPNGTKLFGIAWNYN